MAGQASSGPAIILASGQATTFFGHGLVVRVPLAAGRLYTLTFTFRSDPSVEGPAVSTEATSWGLTLTLTNFDGDDGRGSATPVLLGEEGGQLYFLHFRVFRFGRTDDRTVHYTVYQAARDDVGWRDRGS